MRIVVLLFQFFVFVGLAVALVFLVSREVLLTVAYLQVKQDGDIARAAVKGSQQYATNCKKTFVLGDERYALQGMQLRFISDSEYQVELVCDQHDADPILVKSGKLPMFVSRKPGSSGLYFGVGEPVNAAVNLQMWGRVYKLTMRDANASEAAEKPRYPAASCAEGWGYQCCDSITQLPNGSLATGTVLDCRLSCYSACKNRPLVLSFRSDPFADIETNIVTIAGDKVDVAFTGIVDTPAENLREITLDYGDGSHESFMTTEVVTSHTYSCATFPCVYTAKLIATDKTGVQSPDLSSTSIKIRQVRE